MKIYHNPRCRKSRETLSIITEHKIPVTIIEYLNNPITRNEIKNIIKILNITPLDLIRKEEKLFKEVYKGKYFTDKEYIDILYRNPILIQRPIVIKDNCGVLGRPPINVLDLL